MKLLPATNFGRLVLLIGGVLIAILIIALLVLREVSLSRGGEQIGDLMARQVIAARALERYADRMPLAASDTGTMLELRFASEPPDAAETPRMLFLRQVQARLLEKLGPDAELRIDDGPPTFLWIRDAPNQRWVGIASPEFRRQAVMLTLWVSLSALLLVLAAAGLYARSLSRPLERLASAAGEIARGAFPPDADFPHATREVRELQDALQQSAEAVREAGRERELLLAGVSHDIRTPLARIRLLHEMHPTGDEEADRALARNVEQIDALIGQFTDYARDGREEALSRVDPVAVLESLRDEAAERGVDWRLQSGSGPVGTVDARALALTRALRNLMRNAEAHGHGPFAFRMERLPDRLRIEVRDAGPGIAAAQWDRLRRPFERGEEPRVAGSGLGLAIAERVARAHDGRLERQVLSDGFVVAISLPLSSGDSGRA
ncbi:MAG: ATP-binding protein [Lysobacteraceae bacterium]